PQASVPAHAPGQSALSTQAQVSRLSKPMFVAPLNWVARSAVRNPLQIQSPMLPGWLGELLAAPDGNVPPGKILPFTMNALPRLGDIGFPPTGTNLKVLMSMATSTVKTSPGFGFCAVADFDPPPKNAIMPTANSEIGANICFWLIFPP